MAILEIRPDGIVRVPRTTMKDEKLKERADLQRLLRASIDVIADDILILAEEFGSWEDSRRRIDLLGLDREANLVVIELKRTDDGGHMELQALRYAAMTSVMTFDQAVDAHREYLEAIGSSGDSRDAILEFLQWEEPDEDNFGQDVRMILVSMDFSKEVTTSVLWLNQKGLDIQCIRLTPHRLGDKVLLDVQQIIPLPEAAEYQTKVRKKELSKTSARNGRDLTRFTLRLYGTTLSALPKRHAVLKLIHFLAQSGVSPEEVANQFGSRNVERTVRKYPGIVSTPDILADLQQYEGMKRGRFDPSRWFYRDEDLVVFGGNTYVISSQWGRHVEKYLRDTAKAYPQHHIEIEAVPHAANAEDPVV